MTCPRVARYTSISRQFTVFAVLLLAAMFTEVQRVFVVQKTAQGVAIDPGSGSLIVAFGLGLVGMFCYHVSVAARSKRRAICHA
jgi:hypothetical protein